LQLLPVSGQRFLGRFFRRQLGVVLVGEPFDLLFDAFLGFLEFPEKQGLSLFYRKFPAK